MLRTAYCPTLYTLGCDKVSMFTNAYQHKSLRDWSEYSWKERCRIFALLNQFSVCDEIKYV